MADKERESIYRFCMRQLNVNSVFMNPQSILSYESPFFTTNMDVLLYFIWKSISDNFLRNRFSNCHILLAILSCGENLKFFFSHILLSAFEKRVRV